MSSVPRLLAGSVSLLVLAAVAIVPVSAGAATVAQSADLSITQTVPGSVYKNDLLTYQIQVTNAGPNTATTVKVKTNVTAGMVYQPKAGDPSCTMITATALQCTLPTLALNQSASYTLDFAVSALAPVKCEKTLSSSASVASATKDPNSANNTVPAFKTIFSCTKQQASGNMYIIKDPVTPLKKHQLLGGNLSNDILRLVFRAEGEDIYVKRLVVTAGGQNANRFAQDVDSIAIYREEENLPTGIASVAACGGDTSLPPNSMCAVFTGSGMRVNVDDPKTMHLNPVMKSDVNGAMAGDLFSIEVQPFIGVQAQGASSHLTLQRNDSDALSEGEVFIGRDTAAADAYIRGPANIVTFAKMGPVTNANPDADGTVVPSGVSSIGQFTFSAWQQHNTLNGLDKAVIDGIIFTVTANNVGFDPNGFKVFDKADSSTKADCTVVDQPSATVYTIGCQNLSTGAVTTAIDADQTKTFVLQANILQPLVDTTKQSSLRVSLQNFSKYQLTSFGSQFSHILWLDKDAVVSLPLFWIDDTATTVNSTQYKSKALPPVETVTLNSVVIDGSSVLVSYSKNFTTCAHLNLASTNQILHTANLFCANSGSLTLPLSNFKPALQIGAVVKLCHGNKPSVCSGNVTVTAPTPKPACNDAVDNDADTRIDYPNDLGCLTAADTDETNSLNVVIADFVYQTVNLNGGVLSTPPTTPSFDDVPKTAFYYGHFEDAAKEGWIRGDNNCYGIHPCTARPAEDITRGEAAFIAVRAFGLNATGDAPAYADNPLGKYQADVQAAADHCMLLEDSNGNIHPNDKISVSELPALFQRIDANQHYGVDCGVINAADTTLTVAVQAIGTTDTTVKNEKNIGLLRFQARADGKDILLTSATFVAQSGSLLNLQNYALWVDTNGDNLVDTIVQKGVSATAASVVFDQLAGGGYVVPATQTVIFEVHADVASSLTNSVVQLAFATGTSQYLTAEKLSNGANLTGIKTNGVCTVAACRIIVSTTPSKLWRIQSQGDLFVSRDQQPRSRQLLGGALNEEILRLQFRAQNEDIDVTNLQFNSSGSLATSIDRLELYKLGSTTPFATATAGGCGSDDVLTTNKKGESIAAFCVSMQSQQLVVPDGQNAIVLVRPRLKSDEQGAVSNQTIQIWMTKQAVSDNVAGSGAIRARGAQSSNNLSANNGNTLAQGEVFIGVDTATANVDILGSLNKSVLSKIASISNANPDSDNTNVPTGISPFGQFTFTAATNTNTLNGLNKVAFSGVIFTVNATNVTLDANSFKIYNKTDASNKVSCKAYKANGTPVFGISASGSLLIDCKNLRNSVVETRIASGESVTFVLEGSVTNSKVGVLPSRLQASLQSFNTLSNTAYGVLPNSNTHIEWNDLDTNATKFNWFEYGDSTINSTDYHS